MTDSDSTYPHTEANRPARIREMLQRNILTQKTVRELLTIADKIADLECCCPTHGHIFYQGSTDDPENRLGCPGGDCDGCPDCLSGQARRIITRLGGA